MTRQEALEKIRGETERIRYGTKRQVARPNPMAENLLTLAEALAEIAETAEKVCEEDHPDEAKQPNHELICFVARQFIRAERALIRAAGGE